MQISLRSNLSKRNFVAAQEIQTGDLHPLTEEALVTVYKHFIIMFSPVINNIPITLSRKAVENWILV